MAASLSDCSPDSILDNRLPGFFLQPLILADLDDTAHDRTYVTLWLQNSARQKERLYGIKVFGDACFALAA
ncbi:hypothetical protein NKH19_08425 [Mesorhizobium sp. M1338]|uniref:hypothetical protein n=1 Tax=unclassified Mesorhizobium TaxID=325217 RepID=UPI00333A174A